VIVIIVTEGVPQEAVVAVLAAVLLESVGEVLEGVKRVHTCS
jgi:hypothetical protein